MHRVSTSGCCLHQFVAMSELFRNKYRIPSARLESWDYSQPGAYFVTICTANRKCFFGEVAVVITHEERQYIEYNNEVSLNELGRIAESEWLKTKELRSDMNLELGEYVVMPNHIHGIIFIGENQYNVNIKEYLDGTPRNKFGPQSKNLASVIRGFKSAVTTYARINNLIFNWQTRFHDHIIRSEAEYYRIAEYITSNPSNWSKDEFYPLK